MAEAERGRGRILLALDTGTPLGPALEAAAALAASLQTELAALFVEDERLLRLAALPFAREIGFASATLQSFGLAEMEHALRVQAEQVRRALDEQARRLALAWTLDVMRGELLATSLARLSPGDVLVLCHARHAALPFPERRGGAPRAHAAGPVVVITESADDAGRGLEVGYSLALKSRSAMVVLVACASERAFRVRRKTIERWLRERGGSAHCVRHKPMDTGAAITAARELRASALVLPAQSGAGDPVGLARLLDEVPCPVVVVR